MSKLRAVLPRCWDAHSGKQGVKVAKPRKGTGRGGGGYLNIRHKGNKSHWRASSLNITVGAWSLFHGATEHVLIKHRLKDCYLQTTPLLSTVGKEMAMISPQEASEQSSAVIMRLHTLTYDEKSWNNTSRGGIATAVHYFFYRKH